MARAGYRTNGLQKIEGDDVEKSLELLDKVLSEFEDPDSLPHIEPESPSQGNQSEDDGYMSMNGRRAKIPPDYYQQQEQQQFQTESESSASSPPVVMGPLPVHPSTETTPEETKSSSSSSSPPPPPQVAESIISNLLPRSPSNSPTTTTTTITIGDDNKFKNNDTINNSKNCQKRLSVGDTSISVDEIKLPTEINVTGKKNGSCNNEDVSSNVTDPTTTLPKTRPSTVIPSRYSSLPCNGPIRGSSFSGSFDGIGMKSAMGSGSFDGGRNILGIGISAVHDAVLRGGVAKLPEPIVNEHPVTIYPGRASPPRSRLPPRTLPGSIERHREVCRNLNSPINSSATTTTAFTVNDEDNYWEIDPTDSQLISPLQRLAITKSPSSPLVSGQQQSYKQHHQYQQNEHHYIIYNNNNFNSNNQLVDNKNLLNSFRDRNGEGVHNNINKQECDSDSEEFSDDSLEGQSLPPPPPPPVVPPPPSLSAPVTPSKRGSIAWEINLDDHLPPPPPLQQLHQQDKKKKNKDKPFKIETSPSSINKIITRRRGRSVSGSQSSLVSTPGNSVDSFSNNLFSSPQHNKLRNRASSVEWPEPPDPPVCTTEDEAASLYSDSDEIIPTYPANMTGQGTYVIRKGRRERQRLPELNNSMSSSINSRLSSEGNNLIHSQSNNLLTPNSRHSIDLGSSSHIIQNAVLSPRSRLSLDLSSPNSTSEHPQAIVSSNANAGGITSGNGMVTTTTTATTTTATQQITNISPRYAEFQTYGTQTNFNALHINESNGNGSNKSGQVTSSHNVNNTSLNNNVNANGINNGTNSNSNVNGSLTRGSSLSAMGQQQSQSEVISTPRRELAPPIEEDEEQDSESQRGAPLRQIENNISALLRGDISVARVGDITHARRPLGFRPGVHKSESAKEMLLSQANAFGPLPPSPPTSSPEPQIDVLPPLPPSPQENVADDEEEPDDDVLRGMHGIRITSRTRLKSDILHFPREDHPPPAVPPHRGTPSLNTLKTRSMDAGYTKKYSSNSPHGNSPGTLPGEFPGTNSRRRLMSGAFPKRSAQSPREERRLQTSCSLPETPIFARGCDIPRTPHRRAPEVPTSGSRTAPRTNTTTNTSLNSSIVGIGSTLGGGGRQRSISQALASGEMLRLAGGPARGWYPKQRNQRPASTEHLDRLHRSQGSVRAWDMGGMHGTGGNRKPLTLPPNLTPKFFNKSPREALRRVTSLLIRKGNGKDKESKREKEAFIASAVHRSPGSAGDIPIGQTSIPDNSTSNNHQHKKKGFFKSFWKKSKHYSLDQ